MRAMEVYAVFLLSQIGWASSHYNRISCCYSSWRSIAYLDSPCTTSIAPTPRSTMLGVVRAMTGLATTAIRLRCNHCRVLDPEQIVKVSVGAGRANLLRLGSLKGSICHLLERASCCSPYYVLVVGICHDGSTDNIGSFIETQNAPKNRSGTWFER